MSNDTGQPRDAECIFCRMVAGQIPCHKLYEDGQVLAFLDIAPLAPGHALVIPKSHYATLEQMPGDLAADCMRVVPDLARAILAVTGADAFNVLQNNGKLAHQAVGHVHLHIIPRTEQAGLGINWPAGRLADDQARNLRTKIGMALART